MSGRFFPVRTAACLNTCALQHLTDNITKLLDFYLRSCGGLNIHELMYLRSLKFFIGMIRYGIHRRRTTLSSVTDAHPPRVGVLFATLFPVQLLIMHIIKVHYLIVLV